MKLTSHYVFTAGILTFINAHFMPFFRAFSLSVIISFISNFIIDSLGHSHSKNNKINARTPLTHTFERSMAWGSFSSFIIMALAILNSNINKQFLIMCIVSGIISGPSHMLLDLFTEKGIYIKKNKKWVRFAVMHLRYNNKTANAIAIITGIIMIIISYKMMFLF
ncbi:DUF1286 domain-containing protein [Picrophilus oshimae]|uniref:Hypothetical membrane spanning protein n=1 Tax=Picrophilus torridus (strain ATCC 700027 / DSM 9790 / JCM 10055 / NBRC 100828 / KAW 2/3) TaxID=1122961 RepID=Q6L2W9_PICTO|nr:DUF1286 domain-containing protein [Picrophilus oshimae]AAT42682.1 hypothetical membrane spanning protein [Picrophilus oshimae DSM 9789]SMD31472.1 Protein of unknown function [Picrophilus oshimae DSM 9789]